MAFKIKFEKIQGSWFVMLPQYIEEGGDFADCLMVHNTPELLDILSNNGNIVEVLIDNKPIIDHDIYFLIIKEENDWGYYEPHIDNKLNFNKEIGLCPVNLFVWHGQHPDLIYIKKIK
jgi:hypothetical protein